MPGTSNRREWIAVFLEVNTADTFWATDPLPFITTGTVERINVWMLLCWSALDRIAWYERVPDSYRVACSMLPDEARAA